MADIVQRQWIAWTPGQWLQHLREISFLVMDYTFYGIPFEIEATPIDGHAAILMTFELSEQVYQYAFIWIGSDGETEVPFEILFDSAGASGGTVAQWWDAGGPYWDEWLGLYQDLLLAIFGQLIPAYTNGTLESIEVTEKHASNNAFGQMQARITVSSDFQTRTLLQSFTRYNPTDFGSDIVSKQIQAIGVSPVIGEPGSNNIPWDQMSRIADALEDLTTQSVDVSINHGAQMYSVYGKTITDDVP